MSKGGGQPANQTVTQTSVPSQFYPYETDILNRATAASEQPYQAYQGQRIADFTQPQQQYFDAVQSNQGSYQPYFNNANSSMQQASQGVNTALGSLPNPSNLQTFQMGQAPQVGYQAWDSNAAQQYMNPYMQQVFGALQSDMQHQYGMDQQNLNSQAQQAGVFGGDRSAVMSQTLKDDYTRNLNTQQAQALANAYASGQQAFTSDQFRNLQGQISNQQAGLQTGAQNLASQLGVQQLGAQMGQANAGLGLQGANQLSSLASMYGNLGSAYNGLGFTDANALGQIGLQQQQQGQAGLDTAYSDFVNQNAYAENQLNFLSDILHGVSMPMSTTQTNYSYTSPYASLLGAGLGLSGLAQGMQGMSSLAGGGG